MKKDRKNTKTILIDIEYKGNLNEFEEFYGDNVSYQEIEQESYIEFKNIMFEQIDPEIKFRKYGRFLKCLTIKADMLETEIKTLEEILNNDAFKFTTDWKISNLTLIKE